VLEGAEAGFREAQLRAAGAGALARRAVPQLLEADLPLFPKGYDGLEA